MLFTCGEKHPEPDSDGLQSPPPCLGPLRWTQAAGEEDAALTPELTYSSSSRYSSEFCCRRTAASASRLALRVRTSLGKKRAEG